ncbi:MAG: TetR/AcrR family transcriptional regulator [Pseudomonadota bacterium]
MDMTRRAVNVALRRQSVIDCAEALIAASGDTSFSMEELARHAGVSMQTIYNQFGSKSSLLFQLLNRTVDEIDLGRSRDRAPDPIDRVFHAVEDVVATYLARPQFYRALLRHLFGVDDPVNRPIFIRKGRGFWDRAAAGVFARWRGCPVTADEFADDLLLLTTGALEGWIQHDFTDDEFRAAMRRGTALRLLALGIPDTREMLLATIAAARAEVRER